MAGKPGQARAENHIRSVVAPRLAARGQRGLPPLDVIAREAGVSSKTMWRAVRELKRQRVLVSRRGSGVFLATGAGDMPPVPSALHHTLHSRRHLWRIALNTLRADIYKVRYSLSAPLPSVKELAVSYGVSVPTMRKVLRALQDERLVESHGRRFRVAALPGRVTATRIALVRRRYPWEDHGRLPVRQMEDLHILENECERLGLEVSTIFCAYKGTRVVVESDRDGVLSSGEGLSSVMGFVVWPMTFSDAFVDVWVRVVATGMPVALMCSATLPLPFLASGTGHMGALVRTSDDFLAGAVVGRYLLSLGHKRVAFLDGCAGDHWAQTRLAGIRSIFAEAGHRDAVTAYVASRPSAVSGMIEDYSFVREVIGTLGQAKVHATSEDARQLYVRLRSGVHVFAEQAWRRGAIEAPAREAYERTDIDVWVTDCDETALECLALLREGGKNLRPISIIGFDNIADGLRHRLTSYDFGSGEAVRTALGFLLRPNSFGHRLNGMFQFQTTGRIVERGSVRRADCRGGG